MKTCCGKILILTLLSLISIKDTTGEIISATVVGAILTASGAAAGGWYSWDTLKDNTICKFTECCNNNYIPFDTQKLQISLSQKIFGQPLVYELVNILNAHKHVINADNNSNRKALVLSLHGWSGVGKNFAATMVVEALFQKGLNSKYVKLFMGEKDFDCSDIPKAKQKLISTVNEVVKKCPTSLLIFDEVHDMCPSVLDALKPMLDHHHAVDGVDYRNSIFIFISNIGGQEIATNLLELYNQGIQRNEVDFHNFEPVIRRTAYYTDGDRDRRFYVIWDQLRTGFFRLLNKWLGMDVHFSRKILLLAVGLHLGGFEKSSTISHHLIDHYIPFLPLEQQHVEMCALAEFRARGVLTPTEDMMNDALSIITYGPTEEQPIFANNGCKRFTKHIPYVIQKHRTKKEL